MTGPTKNSAVSRPIVHRLARLESVQRDTNRRRGRIEATMETSSRLFELMHDRLEAIEGIQRTLVEGQKSLVEGQKLVIARLDRLVAATLRERTRSTDRLSRVERRLNALENRLLSPKQ